MTDSRQDGPARLSTGSQDQPGAGGDGLLAVAKNLSQYHREHEKYYSEAPLTDVISLQRAARTLIALAERWTSVVPAAAPAPSPFAGTPDLNDDRAIETSGVLFMEGGGEPHPSSICLSPLHPFASFPWSSLSVTRLSGPGKSPCQGHWPASEDSHQGPRHGALLSPADALKRAFRGGRLGLTSLGQRQAGPIGVGEVVSWDRRPGMSIGMTVGWASEAERRGRPGHAPKPWRASAPSRQLAYAGIALVISSVAACSSTSGGGTVGASASAGSAAVSSEPASSGPTSLQQQYEQVVSRVLPSVVEISTREGSGSGVVYDSHGDIVTNAHVVGTAATVQVSPASGGKALTARVLGVFAPDDLAVIRVQSGAGSLHPTSFGRSASVRVGEIVLAMGNPLGLNGTVTDGIVSATGRTVSEGQGSSAVLISAIQTSAAINPGNSGGALADLSSQVIGIPTLAATDPQLGGATAGIGFAIPSDTVTSVAGQLIATGKVTSSGRASLGVSAQTVADASGQPAGVGMVSVAPGGAAAKAGILAGDIIQSVAGQPTGSVTALQSVLATHKPGDQVPVRLSRNGTQSTVTVTLGSLTS
jgi:S1-C subfamily serine protease